MPVEAVDLTLRAASPDDRDFVYATKRDGLQQYAVATWGAWDEVAQRRRFDEAFQCLPYRIIVVGGAPAGFIETYDQPGCLRIANIAVVAGWRNRGVGSAVIEDLWRRCGCEVRLRVLKVNPARRFYERLGFRVAGDPDVHWWEMVRSVAPA